MLINLVLRIRDHGRLICAVTLVESSSSRQRSNTAQGLTCGSFSIVEIDPLPQSIPDDFPIFESGS
jgi:hypothetical protein